MPRLRPATSQTPSAEEGKKAAAIAAAAEAKRLAAVAAGELSDADQEVLDDSSQDEPAENEAMTALKKQVEDLKKSEEIQRNLAIEANKAREEAVKRSQEREKEVRNTNKEAAQLRLDTITSGMAAAKAEADSATRDLENAVQIGDLKAQSEAYRRLARAETNLARLEDGKTVAEEALKVETERPVEARSEDPLDKSELPETVKNWLRAHPDYLRDQRKNAKVQALHWDVMDEGHAFGSQAYFDSLETHLGLREKPVVKKTEDEDDDDDAGQTRRIVSAPVSREAPANSNGQRPGTVVRLNAKQREAAKMAGITEAEYAKQLQRISKMTSDGSYEIQGEQ